MKKILFVGIYLASFSFCLGQNSMLCGTPSPSISQIDDILKNSPDTSSKKINIADIPIDQYPIKVHIIRNNGGTGGKPEAEINNYIAFLNSMLIKYNKWFFICGGFDYVNNDAIYSCDLNTSDTTILNSANVANAINIYFVSSLTKNSNSIAGYAYFPSIYNYSNKIILTNTADKKIFAHEMGHYFGLYHTYETAFGNELVTRTGAYNWNIAGDLVYDTPADPVGTFYNSQTCTYTGTGLDANNQAYTPDIYNIMSNYWACSNSFSPQQMNRWNIGQNTRTYNPPYNIPPSEISFNCAGTTVAAPVLSVSKNVNNQVQLNWTDNSNNETGFLIIRSNGLTAYSYKSIDGVGPNTTSYIDATASLDSNYYYQIVPSNSVVFSNTVQFIKNKPENCPLDAVSVGLPLYYGSNYSLIRTKFDPSGNKLTVAFYNGGVQLENTQFSGGTHILAKYNSAGALQWGISLNFHTLLGFDIDNSGNIYLKGSFFGASTTISNITLNNPAYPSSIFTFILKYSPNGVLSWAKVLGGGLANVGAYNNINDDIVLDKNNSFLYAASTYKGSVTIGTTTLTSSNGNSEDILIGKFDFAGNNIWVKSSTYLRPTVQHSGAGKVKGLDLDPNGNLLLAGEFMGNITFDNLTLSTETTVNNIYNAEHAILLAKISNAGVFQWLKKIYSPNINSSGKDVNVTNLKAAKNGDFYIIGNMILTTGTNDILFDNTYFNRIGKQDFIAKFNNSGTYLWAEAATVNYGAELYNRRPATFYGLTLDNNDNAYITGILGYNLQFPTISFGNIAIHSLYGSLVAKINKSGTWQWAFSTGSQLRFNNCYGSYIDTQNYLHLMGDYRTEVIFGNSMLYTGSTSYRGFDVKMGCQILSCANNLPLAHPTNDISTNSNQEAHTITATNWITGGQVNYKASQSITLNAGFKATASNGTYFKADMTGCQ